MKKINVVLITLFFLFLTTLVTETCFCAEKITETPLNITSTDYRIGAGDILQIITWKEPDFSLEVTVRRDGKFTFPLLDDIVAMDRTPLEIKSELETKLKDFVEHPVMTVIVKNPQSQKYYILGEIANTGEFQLTKPLTVLQAFALAGGFTEWASKKEIVLLRREGGENIIIKVNYKNIIKGKDLSQNVMLKPDDTIIVP